MVWYMITPLLPGGRRRGEHNPNSVQLYCLICSPPTPRLLDTWLRNDVPEFVSRCLCLVRRQLKTSWDDTGGTVQIVPLSSFSAIQGGSVLGLSMASPVVLVLFVLIELYKFMLTLRSELSLDTGGDFDSLLLSAERELYFHGNGGCRCSPFSYGGGERVHSREHRRHCGRHCWRHRWYGSSPLRLVC